MDKYARLCAPVSSKVHSTGRPFSNFRFIEQDVEGPNTLRRILSQVRLHGGKWMVVEELGNTHDLQEENEDIQALHPGFDPKVHSSVARLSFFSRPVRNEKERSKVTDADFIGYAILKRDTIPESQPRSRIYESVICGSRYPNNHIHGAQRWKCQVDDRIFHVDGYLYAQQNGVTNCCAHVATRTAAARFHGQGDMSYREMNKIVANIRWPDRMPGSATADEMRKIVSGGLGSDEIKSILESTGAQCKVAAYREEMDAPPPPFQKYLYGSIESGYPVILFFGVPAETGAYHTIPVFGHTFNQDAWVPSEELSYFMLGEGIQYIPSESWTSMYLAHDDNFGSNFCVPRQYLYARQRCDKLGKKLTWCQMQSECISYVIATLPKEARIDPIRAEAIGVDFLFAIHPHLPHDQNPWMERLAGYAQAHRLVVRPLLIESHEYPDHLQLVRDWDFHSIKKELLDELRQFPPEQKLWMVELSVPELFSANRRKVGEVLVRAEVTPRKKRDFGNFVLARLPGYFALYEGGGPSNPKFRFIPSGASGHVELFGCEGGCSG